MTSSLPPSGYPLSPQAFRAYVSVSRKVSVLNVYSREFSYFLVGETSLGEGSGERENGSDSTYYFWDLKHGNANERGQMLPRQGEMGESTPFTRKCTSEPSETLERVTTVSDMLLMLHESTDSQDPLLGVLSLESKGCFVINENGSA